MTPFESWALLLLAAATLVMLLRVHYLTGQRVRACDWCGHGYRGDKFLVIDDDGVLGACCSAAHAQAMAESIWLGQP